MGSTAKKIAFSAIILLLLIGGIWYFLITSYTPELTTENEVELVDSQAELSESENDLLYNNVDLKDVLVCMVQYPNKFGEINNE